MRFTQVGLMTADLEKAKQGVIHAAAQAAQKDETEMEKLEREAMESAEAGGTFIPSPNFIGAKAGYAFKNGRLGVGYYKESPDEPEEAVPADHNPEEINIDDDDENEDDTPMPGGTEIEEKGVPVAVFGSVKRNVDDDDDESEGQGRPKRSRA